MIFSITTCKRLELFKRTLTSFREKCLDWSMVSELLVFDDNSTLEDRLAMAKFCFDNNITHEIYLANGFGHVHNLNTLLYQTDYITTEKFMVFGEDDWSLERKGSYITAAMAVMLENHNIGQVCFGREAVEGLPYSLNTGVRYVLLPRFDSEKRYCPFTLNPGVWRVDAFRKVGLFEGENFEYTYGRRFDDHGWRTAHLWPANLNHIGHGNSAYDLNQSKR